MNVDEGEEEIEGGEEKERKVICCGFIRFNDLA